MKLYSRATSPYAVRVLTSLKLKGLEVELLDEPADGLSSPAFKAINPLGKLPVLILDSGEAIAESLVIQEFLEDRYPQPSLRPADPVALARMRIIGRLVEQHIDPCVLRIVMAIATRSADFIALQLAFDELREALGTLVELWHPQPYAVGPTPTLLDGQLLPVMTYLQLIAAATGIDAAADLPAVAAYQVTLTQHPVLAAVAAQLSAAVMARLGAE